MLRRSRPLWLASVLALLALAAAGPALAAQDEQAHDEEHEDGEATEKPSEPEDEDTDAWREKLVITNHSLSLAGQVFDYTATTGTMTLKEEDGTSKAHIFFVAYTRDGVEDTARRPIMFCFNGGPGSSSVWLHMGAYGPRRVLMPDDATQAAPPYRLVDNQGSLLDVTDLVFIDPVTTGYSRAAEGEEDDQFHGVREDMLSVAEFIRLYTTRFQRWNSPKFLSGESYGTTRAAGLAGVLQDNLGMYLNGMVLVSSILDFQTARFDPGNDLPYPLFLPTYTATAFYHGQLAPELQQDLRATLDEAEAFAMGPYRAGLSQGGLLPAEEADRLAVQLARYTGLSADYLKRCHLRPKIYNFVKELLRDEDLTTGRLDSRYRGRDRDSVGATYEFDPSYAAIQGPYTATLNHYLRTELEYESDLPYEILTGRVQPWNYGNINRYVNVAETLRSALEHNPYLKVFVANGYYDLATPYFATEHTFAHMGLHADLLARISMGYYEAGHMMYIHGPSLQKLKADVAAFIASALPDDR